MMVSLPGRGISGRGQSPTGSSPGFVRGICICLWVRIASKQKVKVAEAGESGTSRQKEPTRMTKHWLWPGNL